MEDFPNNAVVVRFGTSTPFWVLSMSYGIFLCPTVRKTFQSVDQYIAYRMLHRLEDRSRIMKTPNGYLANNNLQQILRESVATEGNPVISPEWEQESDEIMHYCLQQKFTQSAVLANVLLRTGNRPIFDDSRSDDLYWCYANGRGKNIHAKMLEKVRAELADGELMPMLISNHARD